jgi:hypothetical protein
LFTTKETMSGREQADVTGLIGQYAHGNEPSHHMAYLFNYAGQPWRTQELVNKICKEFYKNDPDGLIGNEDCGQMSAWYIFSAMGFYPVTPGGGQYALGTPVFDEVILHQENGKTFTINAHNRNDKNIYVQGMLLNDQPYEPTYIKHTEIEKGGKMVFEMGAAPNYNRGTKGNQLPVSSIEDNNFVAVPYFEMNSNKIKEKLPVVLKHIDKAANIFYSIQKEKQRAGAFIKYTKPFIVTVAATVHFYADKNGKRSATVSQQFYKMVTDRTISIKSEVHPMYTAGGQEALIDGITGTANWKTGEWQSYFAKDFEAVITFKKQREFSYMGIHVLQDVSPWIVYPKEVTFEISEDGIQYKPLLTVTNKIFREEKETQVQQLGGNVKASGRYIRIKAINGGPLPAWHESAGQPSHLFIDEIIVK